MDKFNANLKEVNDLIDQDQERARELRDMRINIHTEYVRSSTLKGYHRWVATFDNYDGTDDARVDERLMGTGDTEQEAIDDLMEQKACLDA